MKDSKIIEQLSTIITELDARECSNNCPTDTKAFSWDQLCNLGIGLFEHLKHVKGGKVMDLKYANEILNINGIFIDKCTATGKYFWMTCADGNFGKEKTGFDTVQEAFDDALTYLLEE